MLAWLSSAFTVGVSSPHSKQRMWHQPMPLSGHMSRVTERNGQCRRSNSQAQGRKSRQIFKRLHLSEWCRIRVCHGVSEHCVRQNLLWLHEKPMVRYERLTSTIVVRRSLEDVLDDDLTNFIRKHQPTIQEIIQQAPWCSQFCGHCCVSDLFFFVRIIF